MAVKERKTFREILQEAAPETALKLEVKARHASWLAKIEPQYSSELYSVKHAALRQLFRVAEYAPLIRDAWTTNRGFLLSVRLNRTGSLLHVPFSELNAATRQTQGAWIARRARDRRWQGQRGTCRYASRSVLPSSIRSPR
jgi:hypothetical protein